MTEEQFAELYAINLFNQEVARKARKGDIDTKTWDELTKKERNAYREIADNLLEEL